MPDPVRPVAPRMELGVLLDLLGEAACLLDDGAAAPTETLRAIYRDVVHEAMDRLRLAVSPVPWAGSGAGAEDLTRGATRDYAEVSSPPQPPTGG